MLGLLKMATSGGKQCCLGTVNWPIEKRERPDAFRSLIQYLPVLQAQTLSTRLIEIRATSGDWAPREWVP